jgi:hypothetical protein
MISTETSVKNSHTDIDLNKLQFKTNLPVCEPFRIIVMHIVEFLGWPPSSEVSVSIYVYITIYISMCLTPRFVVRLFGFVNVRQRPVMHVQIWTLFYARSTAKRSLTKRINRQNRKLQDNSSQCLQGTGEQSNAQYRPTWCINTEVVNKTWSLSHRPILSMHSIVRYK